MSAQIAFRGQPGARRRRRRWRGWRRGTARSPLEAADVIVALGGDGFMLQTLHADRGAGLPVYGMNCGTIGFLMNDYAEDGCPARLAAAEEAVINPLGMRAMRADGSVIEALAINEVSLLRAGPQAAKLRSASMARVRLAELVCDGALVATPAGRRPTTIRRMGRSCPSGPRCWR